MKHGDSRTVNWRYLTELSTKGQTTQALFFISVIWSHWIIWVETFKKPNFEPGFLLLSSFQTDEVCKTFNHKQSYFGCFMIQQTWFCACRSTTDIKLSQLHHWHHFVSRSYLVIINRQRKIQWWTMNRAPRAKLIPPPDVLIYVSVYWFYKSGFLFLHLNKLCQKVN